MSSPGAAPATNTARPSCRAMPAPPAARRSIRTRALTSLHRDALRGHLPRDDDDADRLALPRLLERDPVLPRLHREMHDRRRAERPTLIDDLVAVRVTD